MQYVILDTCVILHILRGNVFGEKAIAELNKLSNSTQIISVVTKAELDSFKIQNGWGGSKTKALDDFLNSVISINIDNSNSNLLASYSRIDTYSKGKNVDLHGNPLKGSHRNMGKNDLWIAATALTLSAPLITADGDFDHLNSTLLQVIKIQ